MDLKPFDLLFYKGKSIISKTIKNQTNSNYSHVALVMDNLHVVEIDRDISLGINHIKYRNSDVDIYRLKEDLSNNQKEQIIYFIYSTLNAKYDFIEILDFILYKLFKITLKSNPNKFICSGWINECFKSADIILSDKTLISPQDLICDKLYKVEYNKDLIKFSYKDERKR